MGPQQGDTGDPPQDEGVDSENIDYLDPYADGVPVLLDDEVPDE